MNTQLSESKRLTGDELFAMGDTGPCELIDGRMVAMSPTGVKHGIYESRLIRYLGNFVDEHQSGWVLGGEVGVYISRNPDRIRGVDIAVISKASLPSLSEKYLEAVPELIIEIVSPNDRWQDMQLKIEEYFSIGVKIIWIVEPDNKDILVYKSKTSLKKLTADDTLEGEGILAGFALPIDKLFADID